MGLYASVVLVIGKFVREFFSGISHSIMFEELPCVDRILKLCTDVFLSTKTSKYRYCSTMTSEYRYCSTKTSDYSIMGLYASVVLVIGKFVREFFSGISHSIMFEELPCVDRILKLCTDVFLEPPGGLLQTFSRRLPDVPQTFSRRPPDTTAENKGISHLNGNVCRMLFKVDLMFVCGDDFSSLLNES
ncbi:hypothetical protein F2P81_019753 [Scophthalmus maximus]|uniref:Piezo non-specific cation channel cap domain-containing protein n=1 Tax=Scophthalmus maximus TaxID=52904 RepID=A0A6A4S0D1_SCOMX|nr:hypothetical protein F2P81_019753 [Scophthalmus maximus]